MMDVPIGVRAVAAEPGFTPTAFLAVVEYVDPDGNMAYEVVSSDGITSDRKMRLAAALAEKANATAQDVAVAMRDANPPGKP